MKQIGIATLALLTALEAHAAVIAQINDLTDSSADITVGWDASGLGSDASFATTYDPNGFVEAAPYLQDQYRSTQADGLSITIETPFQPPVWVEVHFPGSMTDPQLSFGTGSSQPEQVALAADGMGLEFHLGSSPAGLDSVNVPDSGASVCLAGFAFGLVVAIRRMKGSGSLPAPGNP